MDFAPMRNHGVQDSCRRRKRKVPSPFRTPESAWLPFKRSRNNAANGMFAGKLSAGDFANLVKPPDWNNLLVRGDFENAIPCFIHYGQSVLSLFSPPPL